MRMRLLTFVTGFVALLSLSVQAASPLSLDYERRWFQILADHEGEARAKSLETLLADIDQSLEKNNRDAGLLVVRGNTNMEIAAALNSMSSLGYLKDGKKDLEKAIKYEPMIMSGMAEASLSASIYWAPGWPLSYGDQDEAMEMFTRYSQSHPDSTEILIQYAHILNSREKYDQARPLFEKALAQLDAITTADRELFIKTRKQEVLDVLNTMPSKSMPTKSMPTTN